MDINIKILIYLTIYNIRSNNKSSVYKYKLQNRSLSKGHRRPPHPIPPGAENSDLVH